MAMWLERWKLGGLPEGKKEYAKTAAKTETETDDIGSFKLEATMFRTHSFLDSEPYVICQLTIIEIITRVA